MSANGATVQGESYVYGGVLFQRVANLDPATRPRVGFGTSLLQGVTTSTLIVFLALVVGLLTDSNNPYNFLIILYFGPILSYGLVLGVVEGLVIWICTRLAGHNLRWFTRIVIAALVFSIPSGALFFSLPGNSYRTVRLTELLLALVIPGAFGALFGLLTGSRFSPWRQLVRGDKSLPAGSWFLTGFTGSVLRVAIAFFLMEAVLAFIVFLQSGSLEKNFFWSLALLLHFSISFVIVSVRLNFFLLVPLALINNVPIVLFLNYLLSEEPLTYAYLCAGYLGAWAAFLISRCALTYRMLDFLKEEAKYYLID